MTPATFSPSDLGNASVLSSSLGFCATPNTVGGVCVSNADATGEDLNSVTWSSVTVEGTRSLDPAVQPDWTHLTLWLQSPAELILPMTFLPTSFSEDDGKYMVPLCFTGFLLPSCLSLSCFSAFLYSSSLWKPLSLALPLGCALSLSLTVFCSC